MSIDLDIFRKAGADQGKDEQARRAVKAFRALQPTLSAYARVLTKRTDVRVEMAARDNGSTDGTRIFFRPPLALGDSTPHERRLCDKRDDTHQLLCIACATRETVLVTIYHEIAHIAYDSFAKSSDMEKAELVAKAVEQVDGKYAAFIAERIRRAPVYVKDSYQGMAALISEFLPMIVNGLEDARVNREMFKARRGTKVMFDADVIKTFTQGVEQVDSKTGETIVKMWNEYPLNLQVIVGLFCKASGYEYTGWFVESVEEALGDEELTSLVRKVDTIRSAGGVYHLSFPILTRLRELGFCKSQMDPQEEPEPEEEPEAQEEPDQPQPEQDKLGEKDKGTNSADSDSDSSGDSESDDSESDDAGDEASGERDSDESADEDQQSDGDGESESDEAGEPGNDQDAEQDGTPDGDDQQQSPVQDGDSEDAGGDDSEGDDQEDEHNSGAGEDGEAEDAAPDEQHEASEGDDDSAGSDQPGTEADDSDGTEGDLSDDKSESTEPSEGASEGDSGSDESPTGDDAGSGDFGDDADDQGGTESGGSATDDENLEQGDSAPDVPEGERVREDSLRTGEEGDVPSGQDGDGAGLDLADGDDQGAGPADSDDDLEGVEERGDEDSQKGVLPEQGEESEGGELIDSGADDGTGGTQLIEDEKNDNLPMGNPDEVQEGLSEWCEHMGEEKPKTLEEGDDESAIDRAIVQGIYFETPSKEIFGVREHHFGSPIILDGYDLSAAWNSRRWDGFYGGAVGRDVDLTIPESLMGPALLRMRVAFSDNQRGKETNNMKSGKINARVLGKRAHHGDPRLFKRKTLPGKKSYFVLIGMDVSGSTVGENLALEKKAVMAQATLLARMGIPFAIYAHSGNLHAPMSGRNEGLDVDIYLIKEEGEVWDTKTKERLEKIGPDAGNLDGHTLEYYRKVLDKSSATDKIIMYYTDGKMPASNHDEELEILQRELKICKNKGYTVMGVGIRTDSPIRHGLDTVQVDDGADLVKVVRHLEKRLMAG